MKSKFGQARYGVATAADAAAVSRMIGAVAGSAAAAQLEYAAPSQGIVERAGVCCYTAGNDYAELLTFT